MITGNHIRAARAWLDWSQNDLADRAGVSHMTVRRQEQESGDVKEATRLAIIRVLAAEGIEFTPNGIVQRELSSYLLDGYLAVLEDIEATLRDGGEVLKHCVDDRRSTPDVIARVAQMRANGIRERLTISDDNDFITGNPDDYRRIPKDYFASSEIILIYGDKVVFFTQEKALVLCSSFLARVFRDQFVYWWEKGAPVHGT